MQALECCLLPTLDTQLPYEVMLYNWLHFSLTHELWTLKVSLQFLFLPSVIIMLTRNEPWNTENHKADWNPPIRNHKSWPFELVEVNFFWGLLIRWLTAAKNTSVCWLLNLGVRVFLKRAATAIHNYRKYH